MRCDRSVITMIFFRLGYLVYSLDNCVITLPTETVLIVSLSLVGLYGRISYLLAIQLSWS